MGKLQKAKRRFRRQLPNGSREWQMFLSGVALILVIVGVTTWLHHNELSLKPASDNVTISWLPDTVKQWDNPISEISKKYKIDPDLVAIIMTIESGGDPKAKSNAGAIGLMQITPPTGKDIASKYLKEPRSQYNLQDPRTNIEFGAAYLAELRDVFGSYHQGPSWNVTAELVAAGYNGGPGAANRLDQGRGLTDPQTVIYSRDVYNMWRERHAHNSPTFDRWKERGGSELIKSAEANKH